MVKFDAFMQKVGSALNKVVQYFNSGKAEHDLNAVYSAIPKVLPYIDMAEQIAEGLRIVPPGTHAALEAIEKKYPKIFDGSMATTDEKRLFMLGIAGELVEQNIPGMDTTTARASIQLAFIGKKAEAV